MNYGYLALTLAGALLLTSCLNKKNNSPEAPSIPPFSLLAGKVEQRTITLQNAAGQAVGKIIETYGRQGEILQRDSLEVQGGSETLRLRRIYTRSEEGALRTVTTRRIEPSGTTEEVEQLSYMSRSPEVSLLQGQVRSDQSGRKLSETLYTYLGYQLDASTETIYSYPAGGAPQQTVYYTSYRSEGVLEVSRTYTLVPSSEAGQAAHPLYHREQRLRRDLYGRPVEQEVRFFDTSVGVGKQDLTKPRRVELTVLRYNPYGDEEQHAFSAYVHNPGGSESPSTAPEGSKTYLALSELFIEEVRYGTLDRQGFPQSYTVTQTRGLDRVKTTTTRSLSYRFFPATAQ